MTSANCRKNDDSARVLNRGPSTHTYVSLADPFCPDLTRAAAERVGQGDVEDPSAVVERGRSLLREIDELARKDESSGRELLPQ